MFGGNYSFVPHRSTRALLDADSVFSVQQPGYFAFIDFLQGKRKDCVRRIAKSFLGGPTTWPSAARTTTMDFAADKVVPYGIFDLTEPCPKQILRTDELTAEQQSLPLMSAFPDQVMCELVDKRWENGDDSPFCAIASDD